MSKLTKKTTSYFNINTNIYLEFQTAFSLRKKTGKFFEKPEEFQSSLAVNPSDAEPLILIGMHRSGTTLVTKLLHESGVFMGAVRGIGTEEALFFQNINKGIFSVANASWDVPEVLAEALQNERFFNAILSSVSSYLGSSPEGLTFTGWKNHKKNTVELKHQPWGWKDPRNSFTLPVWRKLFPNAKVIYIYRNAIDVAQSLHYRNQSLMGTRSGSVRCLTLEGAYHMWEQYNYRCLQYLDEMTEKQICQACYEDLLSDPVRVFGDILRFAGRETEVDKIRQLTGQIDNRKAFAFRNREDLMSFYEKVRHSELMEKFGYSAIGKT